MTYRTIRSSCAEPIETATSCATKVGRNAGKELVLDFMEGWVKVL